MRALLPALLSVSIVAMAFGPAVAGGTSDSSRSDAFTFRSIDGGSLPLSTFRGRVLLVVNTASFCGYTKQYSALQAVWERYEPRGLTVIGVPSNDFGGQEPNSEAEIKGFCQGAFGVTFPLTAKMAVTGNDAHPFYVWARRALGASSAPRWNFHKYLVGRDGRLIAAFPSRVEPDGPELVAAIEKALAEPAAPATQ